MVYMKTQQILVPHQVYIGDNAEIRCTFESEALLFRDSVSKKGLLQLPKDGFLDSLNAAECDVKNIQFQSNGGNSYTVIFSVTPWHTGKVSIPDYDIGFALNGEPGEHVIKVSPVSISSIVQTESINTLMDMDSPLLLPGTTYKIYGSLLLALIFVFVIIRMIAKRKSLSFYIKNKLLLWKYARNKRLTFKALNDIQEGFKNQDDLAASEIQKVMRNYLEFRLSYPFTTKVTSELMGAFYEATCNLLSDVKAEACEAICGVFVRTDYIRYSKAASFNPNEREQLITTLMNSIDVLEKEDPIEENFVDEEVSPDA